MTSRQQFERAVDLLRADGLVAVPTETVWGICACARSAAALAALRRFKGRSEEKAISVFVASRDSLAELGADVTPLAAALIDAFWPGPLTLVLPGAFRLARGVALDDAALGVRSSPHPTVAALVHAAERAGLGPLTATSLNRSGEPPAGNLDEALAVCGSLAAVPPPLALYDGVDATGGLPSTVLDLTGPAPRVLREGAVGPAALEPVLGRFRHSDGAAPNG